MMKILGYLLALFGIYCLYINVIIAGGIFLFVGGFFSKKISISIRGSGVLLMLLSFAYGWHNEFTAFIIILTTVGFVMAHTKNREALISNQHAESYDLEDHEWGFDFLHDYLSNRQYTDSTGSAFDSDDGGDGGD